MAKTIQFKIYLHPRKEQSRIHKQEGWVAIIGDEGTQKGKTLPFDYFDQIPERMRTLIQREGKKLYPTKKGRI